MDALARASASERAALFEEAATRRNVTGAIIEKDFWVCWALRCLFTLQDPAVGFIFKGGTSLSKAYGLIERFSEDVDLSLDRHDMGFTGDRDPGNPEIGSQQRKRLLGELAERTSDYIEGELLTRLNAVFTEALEGAPYSLRVSPGDRQTLLFDFPSGLPYSAYGGGYIAPSIKLEFGSRSDHLPVETRSVVPYAAETFPDVIPDAETNVRVLSAERTFWEKATILHQLAHRPADKPFAARMSRHYADLAALATSDVRERALAQPSLLLAVAEHKSRLFRDPKARYDEARPGSLVLSPPEALRKELTRDYRAMREMFFGEPLGFDRILDIIATLEAEANAMDRT